MKSKLSKQVAVMAVAGLATLVWNGAWAQEHATRAEAEAMVKKGVAYIKANGKDKGYAEISNKQGQFKDRDLYLVVYGLDGKEFVKERVHLGKTKPSFWQDYKFTNPVTRKIGEKSMYCERLDETVVCGGVYKS